MHPRWILAVILGTFPAAVASAQQSHLDLRRQIEQLAATFSERYNKQDAGAIANMFTKDAVRVTSGNSAPSVGSQAIEKIFKTQFESGFRHIDLVVDQVAPFGTDAAITVGRYEITGRGQDGPHRRPPRQSPRPWRRARQASRSWRSCRSAARRSLFTTPRAGSCARLCPPAPQDAKRPLASSPS